MKKFLLFLSVMLIGNNIHSYSQSGDYTRYYNQIMQIASGTGSEISRELQRSSRLAMSSSNKDIYVLYVNGNKVGSFADEWSCKSHINSIKLQINSMVENIVKGLPPEAQRMYGNQCRSAMKTYINSINFTYRRESNPNYRPSGLSNKNNGVSANNSNMSDYFQKANQYYQDNGRYSPFNQSNSDNKEDISNTPTSTIGTQENNPLESLVVSDKTKNSTHKTIEDALAVNSNSPNQTDIISQLQGRNKEDHDVVTYIGSSRPSYNDPSELSVNTQQDIPVEGADVVYTNPLTPPVDYYSAKHKLNGEMLNEIKDNMTDDQYISLRAYWSSEIGNEPDFVTNKNGTYLFKENNILYEVTPNKFFTSLVSVKKTNIDVDGNYNYSDRDNMSVKGEVEGETSLAVIMKDGKIISLKKNTEGTAEAKLEDESFSNSKKLELGASGSKEVSYSSGVNVNIKDEKISLSMIEAHISGGSNIGIDLGYTVDTNNKEIAVSLGAGDFKYKKDDDGFKVDASAGLAGGATIKDNEKSIRAGGDVGVANVGVEIGYKEKDCTNLYANNPNAVVHLLKNEIKSSEEKLNKISVSVSTTSFVMGKEKIKQDIKNEQAKIEKYNNLIKKIEITGSTDGVMYYSTVEQNIYQ